MKSLYALPILVATMILTACASIGRPDGGARDEQPLCMCVQIPLREP